MPEGRSFPITKHTAAQMVIQRISEGVRPDQACLLPSHPEFTRADFRRELRRDPQLMQDYNEAREDFVREQADGVIAMSDELVGGDKDEVAVMRERIKTRQWAAERLLDEYKPKTKNEHLGTVSLEVVTGVPRLDDESIKDAEIAETLTIEDLL